MTPHFANWSEQTLDLAIDRFTVGLDERERQQLDRSAQDDDLREFESAIAAIHLGALHQLEAPRAELLRDLERLGRAQVEGAHAASSSDGAASWPPRGLASSRSLAIGGWLVAASLLVALLFTPNAGEADAAAQREALIARADDAVLLEWTSGEDPAAKDARGDVVWSSSSQEGYMRFEALEANDPSVQQYQLWIFDPTKPDWESYPVDGGVFDVPDEGEVVVPIDPKLVVDETALFAVTIEVPGGVVVSDRERLVLTAAP